MPAFASRQLEEVAPETLREGEVHVWSLAYQRTDRRAPFERLLAHYLRVPADSLTLQAGEHGKPFLASAPDRSSGPDHSPSRNLHFNWSHSGSSALIALALDQPLGVDLEHPRASISELEIAERYFHRREADYLRGLDAAERTQAFLRLWTGKEAVLKALGHGIGHGLDEIVLEIADGALRLIASGTTISAPEDWQILELRPDAADRACLAWCGPPRRLHSFSLARP